MAAQILLHYDLPGNLTNQQSAPTLPSAQQRPFFATAPPRYTIATPSRPFSLCPPVSGVGPFTYQWFSAGTALAGETNECLSFTNLTTLDLAGYQLIAANSFGAATSSIVTLSFDIDRDGLPDEWERRYFATLSFNGIGDNDRDGISNSDEYRDGTNPADVNSSNFRLAITPQPGGTAGATPLQSSYARGTTVQVKATADNGFRFVRWVGDLSSTNNPFTVTLTTNRTLSPIFEPTDFTIGDAIEQPDIAWASTTPGWVPQREITHDGVDALQCREGLDISWDGFSRRVPTLAAQISLAQPALLSFWWKVSCDFGEGANPDESASFLWSGAASAKQITRETDWQASVAVLPAGTANIEWRFCTNIFESSGIYSDTAWLDQVKITPVSSGPVWSNFTALPVAGLASTGTLSLTYARLANGSAPAPPGDLAQLNLRAVQFHSLHRETFRDGLAGWQVSSNAGVSHFTSPAGISGVSTVYQEGGTGKHFEGLYRTFDNLVPDWMTFNLLVLGDADAGNIALSGASGLGSIAQFGALRSGNGIACEALGLTTEHSGFHGVPVVPYSVQRVALRFDWREKMIDLYVDGLLVAARVSFRTHNAEAITRIDLYNHEDGWAAWNDIHFWRETSYPGAQLSYTSSGERTADFRLTSPRAESNLVLVATMPDGRSGITPPFDVFATSNEVQLFAFADRDQAEVGETITYTVAVRNPGPSSTSEVVVTNRLPQDFRVIRFDGFAAPRTNSAGAVVFTFGTLAPQTEYAVQIVGTATNGPRVLTNEVFLARGPGTSSADIKRMNLVTQVRASSPIFVTHPQGGRFSIGVHTLEAVVRGAMPITYQWWRDGVPVPGATLSSLTLNPANAAGGVYFVTVSNLVGMAVSQPARVIYGQRLPLVNWGSDWRYSDQGRNLRTAWLLPGYDDSNWRSGPAPLGYGDPLATIVSFGPDANDKFPTTYFRKQFTLTRPAAWADLEVNVVVDDGAVIYLNGIEVVRHKMPPWPISYGDFASDLVDGTEEPVISTYANVSAGLLREGVNTLAVEVHQFTNNSSDIRFDLRLSAEFAATLSPNVTLLSPIDGQEFFAPAIIRLQADASDPDGSVTNVAFVSDGVSVGTTGAPPYSILWTNVPAGLHTLEAVATDNEGLASRSVFTRIRVVPPRWSAQAFAVANGVASFALLGASSHRYTIQATVDLIQWEDAGEILTVDGVGTFSVSLDGAQRFFRVKPEL